MRNALSSCLVAAARANKKAILLTGDHGYSLFDEFRKHFPAQFINAGIAEQNMVGMAAGLAKKGFFPIVYGLSAFVPIRVLEQIKIDICYESLPVLFLGDGAGFVYSHLGVSHQSTEDIAALCAIPNINIYSPADRFEMQFVFESALRVNAPSYIRIGKSDLGDIHGYGGELGEMPLINVKPGNNGTVFLATGSMVKKAISLAKRFEEISVYSVPKLKPLDSKKILRQLESFSSIVTFEEHSIHGGLGACISGHIQRSNPKKICTIGVRDTFLEKCGSYEYLLKEAGLDEESMYGYVSGFLGE